MKKRAVDMKRERLEENIREHWFKDHEVTYRVFGGGGNGGKKSHRDKYSEHRNKYGKCEKSSEGEISKWQMYDKFWEDQGNQAFEEYVAKRKSGISEEE